MSNNTIHSKAVLGRKVSVETKVHSHSTTIRYRGNDTIKVSRYSPSEIGTGFVKVDFSDQRKMDTCRKLNKIMGGY